MSAFAYIALSTLACCSLVTGMQIHSARNEQIDDEESYGQCAKLTNNFVSFSVEVCVGTPPQCFDVVADTGSNTVIVPSCVCQENAYAGCTPGEKCFEGTGKSKTFSIPKHPELQQISFGSGTVAGAMATDIVKVGPASTTIENGIFLMTDRAQLQIDEFEGILGLGVPSSKGEDEKLFFEEAKVSRFSLCMSDSVSGALRFNQGSFKNEVRQIGTYHWGLDLRGMSVGKKDMDVGSEDHDILFCSASSMKKGMDSPCGIIPDSGTTMIIGPKAQVAALEGALCDSWPRCAKSASGKGGKSAAFAHLLEHCNTWLHSSKGLYEMPSLFFHLRGKDGSTKVVELSAWAYIVEAQTAQGRVCESMLSHGADTEGADYVTTKNGPIWIVGTPLFYEYNVGFDMGSMSVALEKESCHGCGGQVNMLTGGLKQTGTPRSKRGIARRPQYNISRPL